MSGSARPTGTGRSLQALLACAAILVNTSCEWFTDFKRQPTISTWEVVGDSTRPSRANPEMSVPITGTVVAGFEVSRRPLPGVIDSMSALVNPVRSDGRSLTNGYMYYQINCAVCHGDRAQGDGPVTRFGMPGISLVTDVARARTDGYLFGMIRNGRGLMPPYNRIEEPDRWDVVNYLRALQRGDSVRTGPLDEPGSGGLVVPGPSRTGPTRPAPHWRAAERDTRAETPADTSERR